MEAETSINENRSKRKEKKNSKNGQKGGFRRVSKKEDALFWFLKK